MRILSLLIFLFISFSASAQITYSGNILDSNDKAYLEGVKVEVIGKEHNSLSNSRGYFSVKAFPGDSILISFPGFISQKKVLSTERYFLIELQDKARFLPTFEVKEKPYSYRFKDGRLVLRDENEEELPSRKGEVLVGTKSDDPNGGITISGPISYFTKKARLAREYERKKIWHSRRAGYYEIIESDSIKQELKIKFDLDSASWDQMIIKFNQFHQAHEFLDWSKDRVQRSLFEFFEVESMLSF